MINDKCFHGSANLFKSHDKGEKWQYQNIEMSQLEIITSQDNADKREWHLDRVRGGGQWHRVVIRQQSCCTGADGDGGGDADGVATHVDGADGPYW